MRRQRNFIGPQGMGGTVALWGASSLIKSIQRVSITSVSVTITAVDLANTILVWGGVTGSYTASASGNETNKRVFLSNSTTLALAAGATSGSVVSQITIVEFMPGVVKSIQQGTTTIAISALTGTTAVTPVNVSKSCLFHLGFESSAGSGVALAYSFTNLTINSNGDTITATLGAAYNSAANVTSFILLEYF
jgi:hypothetical protein